MRIRTVKPEFHQSETLGKVSREVRYLATPVNYLVALKQNLSSASPIKAQPKLPIGTDAKARPEAIAMTDARSCKGLLERWIFFATVPP